MADENPFQAPLFQPQAKPPVPTQWAAQGATTQRSPRQWQALIHQRVRRAEPLAFIWDDAVRQGLPPQQATNMIREEQAAYRKSGWIATGVGGALAVLGIVATIASFGGRSNDEFVIWWGPVVFGAIFFVIGLVRVSRASRG